MLDLYEMFEPLFPLGEPPIQLLVLKSPEDVVSDEEENKTCALIQLFLWEQQGDEWSIRDVKEQQLFLGWPALYDDRTRVTEFLEAMRSVIGMMDPESVRMAMPHELVLAEVLKLKKAETRDDFKEALLAQSRLGKYVKTEVD
jgi:hypothetical protein